MIAMNRYIIPFGGCSGTSLLISGFVCSSLSNQESVIIWDPRTDYTGVYAAVLKKHECKEISTREDASIPIVFTKNKITHVTLKYSSSHLSEAIQVFTETLCQSLITNKTKTLLIIPDLSELPQSFIEWLLAADIESLTTLVSVHARNELEIFHKFKKNGFVAIRTPIPWEKRVHGPEWNDAVSQIEY